MNLPNPPNVTDLKEWKVILSTNSSAYGNIGQMLEVGPEPIPRSRVTKLALWKNYNSTR
jgi:hypothetical protein